MQRTINISTDVFAAIWANRRNGEETENAILQRLLGCGPADGGDDSGSPQPVNGGGRGVYDARNDVQFPEGFRVFRIYKRKEYAAFARDGFWVREDDGRSFETLNQLNASIAVGAENVWNGTWKYRADDGSIRPISELRP